MKISALVNIQDWHVQNENARAKDQDELLSRLDDLEANQGKLLDTLSMFLDICIFCTPSTHDK